MINCFSGAVGVPRSHGQESHPRQDQRGATPRRKRSHHPKLTTSTETNFIITDPRYDAEGRLVRVAGEESEGAGGLDSDAKQ